MKIELGIKDRLVIISILPATGSLQDMVDTFEMIKILRFTNEEKEECSYREVNGKVEWDITKDIPKEFTLSFEQITLLKEVVKEMSTNKQIDLNNLDTCLKINKL